MSEAQVNSVAKTLGHLGGDRPCIACGYNLIGQPIAREPHYDMLIVRCAECGTVASLQEYPSLARWGRRLSAIFAAMFLLAQLVILILASVCAMMFTGWFSALMVQRLTAYLTQNQQAWLKEHNIATDANANAGMFFTSDWMAHPDWTAQHSVDALFAEAGGWRLALNNEVIMVLIVGVATLLAIGVVWAAALPGLRRRWLWLALVPVGTLSMFVALLVQSYSARPTWGGGYEMMGHLAADHLALTAISLALTVLLAGLLTGLLIGRGVARLLIRVFLPPALQCSFSYLWTAHGLQPPAPGVFHRKRHPPIV